ncbi:hypothetical protein HMPREF1556_01438 [Porphyromonas sp. oral taxon 278 str. W7784]|nr:hypothetical protein HMPREF1556_01438 [Porphyromonas sp. oral taxon 278 str. W7784]
MTLWLRLSKHRINLKISHGHAVSLSGAGVPVSRIRGSVGSCPQSLFPL